MNYSWQHPDWPEFRYTLEGLEDILFDFAERTGRVSGLLAGLSADTLMTFRTYEIFPRNRGLKVEL